jgi:hypothetical protein
MRPKSGAIVKKSWPAQNAARGSAPRPRKRSAAVGGRNDSNKSYDAAAVCRDARDDSHSSASLEKKVIRTFLYSFVG